MPTPVAEVPGPGGAPASLRLAVPEPRQAPVRAAGPFLWAGDDKLWVKGVTYGTFRPRDGADYPHASVVEADFAAAAATGINAVRTYTAPPRWLLDAAHRHGLRVLVGLAWEQHVAFLDEPGRAAAIEARVRYAAAGCAGHPAVLAYAVGNEIPASIVRWSGRRRVERFLARLSRAVREEDPSRLVTYVSFPTTEYLDLPFLDLVCFNVCLEAREALGAYLARLQNLAGDRPLLLTEIGLDSRRNGEAAQAESLAWQVRAAFAQGCAGAFAFAWTDEWHRGGHDVRDRDFGLTTRARRPKPALDAVREAFADAPFPADTPWPRVSVVVCSFNGARTIRDTLQGLERLDYPDFEVIVVDDGSTDATASVAAAYPVRLVRTPNQGLWNARNTGLAAATGEIVAYIDDDAWPDPHWLQYLAWTFLTTGCAAAGGPNLPSLAGGLVADCIANAPGGPVHVLLSDREAEHLPGCNLAIRRSALEAIGGFDPRYRAAGDDVDVCWRLRGRGGKLAFHAAAVVWHQRRSSLRAFWRQQRGYGEAEALLEQSLYERAPGTLSFLPLLPEWYLVVLALAALTALGASWPPLALGAAPLLLAALAAPIAQAFASAARARFPSEGHSWSLDVGRRLVTTALHLIQPMARLFGRVRGELAPWRRRVGVRAALLPWPRTSTVWSARWRAPEGWVERLEAALRVHAVVMRGGDFDAWDLHVRCGALGALRAQVAVEEHGAGCQLVRLCARPRVGTVVVATTAGFAAVAALAAASGAWTTGAGSAACALLLAALTWRDCAAATGCWRAAVARLQAGDEASVEPRAADA